MVHWGEKGSAVEMVPWGINRRKTDEGRSSLSVIIGESKWLCILFAKDLGWGGVFFLQLRLWAWINKSLEGKSYKVFMMSIQCCF